MWVKCGCHAAQPTVLERQDSCDSRDNFRCRAAASASREAATPGLPRRRRPRAWPSPAPALPVGDRAVMLAIVLAGLVVASTIARGGSGRGTCDFRLAESTRYSNWTSALRTLGVSANTTVNINGEFLGSGECDSGIWIPLSRVGTST